MTEKQYAATMQLTRILINGRLGCWLHVEMPAQSAPALDAIGQTDGPKLREIEITRSSFSLDHSIAQQWAIALIGDLLPTLRDAGGRRISVYEPNATAYTARLLPLELSRVVIAAVVAGADPRVQIIIRERTVTIQHLPERREVTRSTSCRW
jgi:hypothetical protein